MRNASHLLYVSLAIAASTAWAQTAPECPSIPPACSTVEAAPKPKQKCGALGKLNKNKATSDELVIPACVTSSEEQCRLLCAYYSDNAGCQSLSFDPATSTCSLWKAKLNTLGFRKTRNSQVVHYSNSCYASVEDGSFLASSADRDDYVTWYYSGSQYTVDPNSPAGTAVYASTLENDASDTCGALASCRDYGYPKNVQVMQVAFDDSAAAWQCTLYNDPDGESQSSDFDVYNEDYSQVYGYRYPYQR